MARNAIDELRDLLADLRRSPAEWDDFLASIIDDAQIIKSIKAHHPR